jgi:HD-GYP domain-containing protein (c-di-GMP phosphodiesterase class II)
MTDIMESLVGHSREFFKLEEVKRRDMATFIHLLNVSILAMNFAGREGYGKEDALEIGLAALFHDVGKLYLTSLVKKKDRLSDEEFSRVQSHPVLGAQIMLRYVDSLGVLPVVVAFEHHLRFNLKGYPKLTFRKEPHRVSLMVAICDVYDALLARRSYKKRYSPSDAYQIMKKERGEMFEPGLFDKFFGFTGVWPQGTIVILSDGRVAIVRRQNPDDIFLPVVEVVDISGCRETIDLCKNKGSFEIVKALDPYEAGRPYLGFV